MPAPLVSVVIPCFNGDHFIGNAIQSALAQTYVRTEVVVVDDGSKDRSRDVIASFGSIIRWESTTNQGGGAARNRGVELALGELIQFLDADDELHPECVQQKVDAYVRSREFMPCCDWNVRAQDGTVTQHNASVEGDSVVAAVVRRIQTSSPLHRRADLKRVGGFDPALPCSQERDLHLRLACAGVQFKRLPEALFTVNRRPDSVSNDYTRVLLQHYRIYSRAASQLRDQSGLTAARSFELARVLALDGRRLYQRGLLAEARRHWALAESLNSQGARAAFGRAFTRTISFVLGPERTDRIVTAGRALTAQLRFGPVAKKASSARAIPAVFMVSREGGSSVIDSQVFTPIARQSPRVAHQLVVTRPLGDWFRSDARRRMRKTAERAASLGISLITLPAAPSRARALWSDGPLLSLLLRLREPVGRDFVIRGRGTAGTHAALDARRVFPGARVIFDCRGAAPAEIEEMYGHSGEDGTSHARAAVQAAIDGERKAVTEADHVLCVSQRLADYLATTYGLTPERVTVMPCCVDSSRFATASQSRDAVRQELGLQDKFVVVYSGALEWYQRPDLSLQIYRAFARLQPNVHLLALTPNASTMRDLCATYGLGDEDATVMALPPNEVARYLSAGDIGLLPRAPSFVNRVASPVKFAEYLACGLPVAITDCVGDYSDLVRREGLGIVLPTQTLDSKWPDPSSLRPFLGAYLAAPANLRSRCQAVAREQLDIDRSSQALTTLYERLLRSRRGEASLVSASNIAHA